jgi:AbiEi antitoxin C-terminal domain
MRPAQAPLELLNGQPFLVSRARTLGVSITVLRGPLFRRVCRDIYVAADAPNTPTLRLAAVSLILPPTAVLSGLSAAWLLGIDVARQPDGPLEVTLPAGVTLRGRGIFTPKQATLDTADIGLRRGVRVTSPLRTAYDLARRLEVAEAVVTLDALWHRGLVTPDQLMDYAAEHGGLRGVSQISRVVELADRGSDSPMESRLRMLMVLEAGLPKPETQIRVRESNGSVAARLDMGYRGLQMGVEYDGEVHAQPAVRARDLRRHNRLLAHQWHNLRYSADAYYNRRDAVIQEIKETYAVLADRRNDLDADGLNPHE